MIRTTKYSMWVIQVCLQTYPRWRMAAILKNKKTVMTLQWIDWLWQNLAWWCVSVQCTLLVNKILEFLKSKIIAAAVLTINNNHNISKSVLPHTRWLCRWSRRIDCHCHRWVSWWVYSPILEEQILEQWSHGRVPRLLSGCASCLWTAHLCWRTATLSSSNWVTASLHKDLHAEQSYESLPNVDEFIPHFFIFSLTVSLYLLTGPHCGWLPTASCPQNACFGMRLSDMCMTWPTHRSCAFNRNASIPMVPQICSTSVLYCIAIWFQLSCTGSGSGTDPAYRLIVGTVSRSHNHTAV